MKNIISIKDYAKIRVIKSYCPIKGSKSVQLHVKIKVKNGDSIKIEDGYSNIGNPAYCKDRMFNEAINDALINFDGYGYEYSVIKYDYISFISNETKDKL